MASLKHLATGKSRLLATSYLIGRGSACSWRLKNRLATNEHAAFHWSTSGWELRDLSSTNGTFVDGRRLAPGECVSVDAGSRIGFGDPDDLFELADASPPVAVVEANDGRFIEADEDGLVIPDAENPQLIVFQEAGQWFAQTSDEDCQQVRDREVLQCGGSLWRLYLPTVQEKTLQPDDGQFSLSKIELHFAVSRDEEHVAITIAQGNRSRELPHRSHSYLLLTLARARLEDAEAPGLSDDDRGWLHSEDIARMLGVATERIYLLIHRAKQQFRRANVVGATDLIEHRPGTRQRRLGVHRIVIRR